MAAGLSLSAKNLPILKARLQELIIQQVSREELHQNNARCRSKMPDLTKKFIDDLRTLEPFGNQNSHPSFYVKDAVIVQKPMMLKDAHVKCSIFADGVIKPVIFFNRPELFQTLSDLGQDSFDLAVQVNENHWNGRVSIELQGIDIALKV